MNISKRTNKEIQRPFVIHRALIGSFERFFAFLVEHYAGKFPLWLAPVQIKILSISDKHKEYAQKIYKKLLEEDFRVELDIDNESLGKKIRNAKMEKVPYILVIDDKELNSQNITVESRDAGNLGQFSLNDLIEKIKQEIKDKK
ncbi:MAG: His/Gly/Thr/Pro-type tRNA ligase C-terminal domain-containing protein [Patescibacteria group bacterium]